MADMTVEQLANPETNLGLSDFCDWRVFAVPDTYCDSNVSRVYRADSFEAGQPSDGPTYIWVGSNVTDDRLMERVDSLHERYGVTIDQLWAARSGELVRVRIERPAGWITDHRVPADLRERFTEAEAATFEVLRQRGAVRLWKSQTSDRIEHGELRRGKVHYHVTVDDETKVGLMQRMDSAQMVFDDACAATDWVPIISLTDGTTIKLPTQDTHAAAIRLADAEAHAYGSQVEWIGAQRHERSQGALA